jgi:SAM-dependent methyltransferase
VAIASTVFQFVGYSHEALVEWHRILAPGGRLALSIPVQESMQPLNGLMRDFFDRLTPEIQQAWRASGQTPGEGTTPDLQPMCEQAGFRDIDVDDVALEAAFPDFDTWWAHNWTHGSKAFFRNLPPDALDDARAEARRRIEPLLTPTGEVVTTAAMRICTASV